MNEEKCVLVLDENLSLGVAANTAAILGVTLGRNLPELVGRDVTDGSGAKHLGIVEHPVPVLRGSPEAIKTLRQRLYQPEFREVTAVDFSELARRCLTYDEFTRRMTDTPEGALEYLGVAVCGPKKQVNRLTGSLPLLR